EMEAETTEDTRIVLTGTGARNPARLEEALSEAASLTAHLARTGAGIELVGPGLFVRLGRGPGQARRILTALALYEPGRASRGHDESAGGALREIQVGLDSCLPFSPCPSSPVCSWASAWLPSSSRGCSIHWAASSSLSP